MTSGDLELRVAWERHVGRTAPAIQSLESLLNRYREPHRSYHDVRHARWVVRHVDDLAVDHPLDDHGAVVAAACFHDAIYDPIGTDNERASARLASAELERLGWAPDRIDAVAAMIVGTIDHRWEATTNVDTAVLYAADLGVLAATPAGYSDYVRNVRREYRHVDDASWALGRAAVLRSYLERAAIFAPVLGLATWEARARGNLTAELNSLPG